MRSLQAQIKEVDSLRVWILTDNYYDALRPDREGVKRFRVAPGECMHAEHGLAYFVETIIEGKPSRCMFDFGLDPTGVMNNAGLLGIDLAQADAYLLSHGHHDHWSGSIEILRRNSGRIPAGTPFYLGEEAFLHRYTRRNEAAEIVDLSALDRASIEATGVRVHEVKHPGAIIPGGYCTGVIERTTEYESVPPGMLVERNGRIEADDFKGEQALFFKVKGKGLVILSGCAHAGVINTIRQAQKSSGVEEVEAILGGFHLINGARETILRTIADIRALGPRLVVPVHCTGFEALVAFSQAMPRQFVLNTAGTEYTFSA